MLLAPTRRMARRSCSNWYPLLDYDRLWQQATIGSPNPCFKLCIGLPAVGLGALLIISGPAHDFFQTLDCSANCFGPSDPNLFSHKAVNRLMLLFAELQSDSRNRLASIQVGAGRALANGDSLLIGYPLRDAPTILSPHPPLASG